MIYLEKGQALYDNPGMVVFDSTGYYNDGDSVICSSVAFPDEPACRYEARFIKYGSIVYSITNQDELMEQIIKIDPSTLFGKTTKQVALDKVVEKIIPQNTSVEDNNNIDSILENTNEAIKSDNPSSTVSTTTTQLNEVSTTTQPTNVFSENTNNISTTTTPNYIDINNDNSTTTESIINLNTSSSSTPPIIDLSTTTPETISTSTPSEIVEIIENIANNNSSTTQSVVEEIIESTSTSQ
jgi:hypothetical protein